MRKLLFTTAAVSMLAATGASAQILASVDALVDSVIGGAASTAGTSNTAVFTTFANNAAAVGGNVDINIAASAAAGSVSANAADTTSGALSGLNFQQAVSSAGAGSANTNATIDALTLDCLSGTTGTAPAAACGLILGALNLSTDASTSSVTTNLAQTVNIGAVTTAALGAVNSGTITAVMSGASSASASAAETSLTASNASANAAEAASMVATAGVFNTGAINGGVAVDFTNMTGSVGAISTTAAGAINSGNVNGSINDTLAGVIGLPGFSTPEE